MPVSNTAYRPAATSCTGSVGMRRIEASVQTGSDAGDWGRTESLKTRGGTSENRSTRGKPVRRNNGPIDHLHTIPIDTTQPPQLPPWEDFQRGPPDYQAAPSLLGPHRKSFHHILSPLRTLAVAIDAAMQLPESRHWRRSVAI